jgi:hypothetical protein
VLFGNTDRWDGRRGEREEMRGIEKWEQGNFVHKVYQLFNTERLVKTSRIEPFKNKIPSKNMREKPTNTPIIYSVY